MSGSPEYEQSEMIRMCGINVRLAKEELDLLEMAMEGDDLAGVYVYSNSIRQSLKTIEGWGRTVYRTKNEA